jgi:hypothetical protein
MLAALDLKPTNILCAVSHVGGPSRRGDVIYLKSAVRCTAERGSMTPMLFLVLVFGVLGLCVGSFLNVIILRRGKRSLSWRSECMSCAKTLAWYDLIPIASWVILRGRCRACGSSISIQYPLIEAATAILFVAFGLCVAGP